MEVCNHLLICNTNIIQKNWKNNKDPFGITIAYTIGVITRRKYEGKDKGTSGIVASIETKSKIISFTE